MAVLKIIRLGHPKLRIKSKLVKKRELQTKRFQTFVDNLANTCVKSKGVGIAAPQVGVNKRVIVVYVDAKNPRYPDKNPFPLTIVINPKIIRKSKEINEDWEGDLSADLRGFVPRATTCVVTGLNIAGEEVRYDLSDDFHARVFQHEIDHLDGILFFDKVKKKQTISETTMWRKFWKKKKITDVIPHK